MALMLMSLKVLAQKDVTKFLGIPVDGYKTEMKKKLIEKGYRYNSQRDFFDGEFNGRDVRIYIVTNNNKVWRIMVCDANTCSETDIKIRFNKLCRQFENNKKYISTALDDKDYTIPDNEDISYEMLVKNKRYEASYFQRPDPSLVDTLEVQSKVKNELLKEFTQEVIDNPTEKQQEEIQSAAQRILGGIAYEMIEKKLVWFMITESYGQYYISLYYDNEYNHSNGEDL